MNGPYMRLACVMVVLIILALLVWAIVLALIFVFVLEHAPGVHPS